MRNMSFPRHHRRGRIEAQQIASQELSLAVVFHGITAVAELKRQLRPVVIQPVFVFHGITAVAELKRPRRCPGRYRERGFPRHHRRGRIEASCHPLKPRERRSFPRHHRRGRIEA